MTTNSKIAGCALLVLGLSLATGCTTAVKRAYYEVRGAKGEFDFIQAPTSGAFDSCQSVRFEPAMTTIGSQLCPHSLCQAYDRHAAEFVNELQSQYPGGGPALAISSEILFFQKKGLFGAAQLLCRVRFTVDGHMTADALVNVGSKGFREGGTDALTETAVETIGKILDTHSHRDKDEDH